MLVTVYFVYVYFQMYGTDGIPKTNNSEQSSNEINNNNVNNNNNNNCNSNSNTRHMSIPQIEYIDGDSSKKSALAGVVKIKLSDIPNVSLSQSPSP